MSADGSDMQNQVEQGSTNAGARYKSIGLCYLIVIGWEGIHSSDDLSTWGWSLGRRPIARMCRHRITAGHSLGAGHHHHHGASELASNKSQGWAGSLNSVKKELKERKWPDGLLSRPLKLGGGGLCTMLYAACKVQRLGGVW